MMDVLERIDQQVKNNPVVIYMKGTPQFPMCGFSKTVVDILNHLNVSFDTRNVLEEEGLRDGIKQYSQWPTIPQLYVNGKFAGGCDIIKEIQENGEIFSVLGIPQPSVTEPKIAVTPPALQEFQRVLEEIDADNSIFHEYMIGALMISALKKEQYQVVHELICEIKRRIANDTVDSELLFELCHADHFLQYFDPRCFFEE